MTSLISRPVIFTRKTDMKDVRYFLESLSFQGCRIGVLFETDHEHTEPYFTGPLTDRMRSCSYVEGVVRKGPGEFYHIEGPATRQAPFVDMEISMMQPVGWDGRICRDESPYSRITVSAVSGQE